MRVIYCGGEPELYVPALDVVIADGDELEVDDELGASLLEQSTNWRAAGKARGRHKPDAGDAGDVTDPGSTSSPAETPEV